MSISLVYLMITYFKYWGLGFELPSKYLKSRTAIVIATFHIVGLFANVLLILKFYNEIFFSRDLLGILNDIIKYFSTVLAYALTIGESYLKRRSLQRFWTLIFIHNRQHQLQNIYTFRRFFIKFTIFFLLTILIEANLIPLIIHDKNSFNFWSMYLPLLLMGRTRVFQYIFFVEILRQQIDAIKLELIHLEKLCSTLSIGRTALILKKLYIVRNQYALVYDLSEQLNDFFGWSQVAIILHNFMLLVVDFNWTYWRLYNEYTHDIAGLKYLHYIWFWP